MNDSFKTMLAFIGGAVAGAAIGILLAPDKGAETRKKILTRARDLGDDLSDTAMEKYDEFLKWKDSLLDGAEQTVKNAGDKVKHNMTDALNKTESKIRHSQA